MDSLESLMFGLLMNNRNDVVGNDKIYDYTVDTCYTADAGYETAIMRDGGEWVIVARYSSRDEAEKGHKEWIESCKKLPTIVYSVQLNEMVRL